MKSKEFFKNKKILEKTFIDNNLEPEYITEDYGFKNDDSLSFMYPGDHDIIICLYFNGSIEMSGSGSGYIKLFGINIDTIINVIKGTRKRK